MKFKRTVLLATFVVTMGLLLGASTAQAATIVTRDGHPEIVEEIQGLEIGANIYDVVWNFAPSLDACGFPQRLPFNNADEAREAAEAINAALNEAGGITGVGEIAPIDPTDFRPL